MSATSHAATAFNTPAAAAPGASAGDNKSFSMTPAAPPRRPRANLKPSGVLAQADLLSSMTHELRSPLNAILGYAQLMEAEASPKTASQQECIESILRAGWSLRDLIDELLDFALMESGQLELSLESVVLAEVLEECQLRLAPQALAGGITLSFTAPDLQTVVNADRRRLQQVLVTLMAHAIKYNRPGATVRVECRNSGERVRVGVQHTGDDKSAGSSLVVSQRLIELMGGEMGVDSGAGHASMIWIELPRTLEPNDGTS